VASLSTRRPRKVSVTKATARYRHLHDLPGRHGTPLALGVEAVGRPRPTACRRTVVAPSRAEFLRKTRTRSLDALPFALYLEWNTVAHGAHDYRSMLMERCDGTQSLVARGIPILRQNNDQNRRDCRSTSKYAVLRPDAALHSHERNAVAEPLPRRFNTC
jgi:hypothetical protein